MLNQLKPNTLKPHTLKPNTFQRRFLMRLVAPSLALLATACSNLQTPYEEPKIAIPTTWSIQQDAFEQTKQSNDVAIKMPQEAWWKRFDDATLTQLIELALRDNSDLIVAAWNIRQARYAVELSQDEQRPSLSASASTKRARDFDAHSTSRSSSASVGVRYELDLWGHLASQTSAQQWRLNATEQDLQSTAIALVANVAQLYWQLAYQNTQISSGQKSLETVLRTQQIVLSQHQHGAASGLEVQEARRSVASQEAALEQLRQARSQTLNALSVLLNRAPSQDLFAQLGLIEPQKLLQRALPSIPAGIPADVLARRPDLRAAQANLRALLADADAVRTSYYPAINLTAGVDSASRDLADLLSNPIGSIMASLSMPFLQQTQMRLSTDKAKVVYEAARQTFVKSLLVALQEVEDALKERQQLMRQGAWLKEQFDAAQKAEQLNEVRYQTGAVALKNWLDAQEIRRAAQLQLFANEQAQLNSQLMLYKAFGGDVNLPAPDLAQKKL